MSDPTNQSDKKPDKTLLSIFLFVFGVLSLVVLVVVVFSRSDGIFKALPGLAIAAVFFALSRALNYLGEITERQRRIEAKLERLSDKT